MRHLRVRRRNKLALLAVLALTSVVLAEKRIEAIVPGLMGSCAPAGLAQISQAEQAAAPRGIGIGEAGNDLKFWDILAGLKSARAGTELLRKGSAVYANFSFDEGRVAGFAGFKGLERGGSGVSGFVTVAGKGRFDFIGTLNGEDFTVEVRPPSGLVKASGRISEALELSLRLKAERVKVEGLEITCDAFIKNRTVRVPGALKVAGVEGSVEISNLSVNGKPVPDIGGAYSLAGDILRISGMKVGQGITVNGMVATKKSNALDLEVTADNVSLNRLMIEFGLARGEPEIAGTLNGKFALKGPADRLRLESHFDVRKGVLSALAFDHLEASVRGEAPYFRIEDATVSRESGYFTLSGEIDSRRIGRDSFFRDVNVVTEDGAMSWDSWEATAGRGATELKMSKSLTSDIGVAYRKYRKDDRIDESVRGSDQVRLEYKLGPNESLGLMLGKDNDYLGFEHRDRF